MFDKTFIEDQKFGLKYRLYYFKVKRLDNKFSQGKKVNPKINNFYLKITVCFNHPLIPSGIDQISDNNNDDISHYYCFK